MRTVRRSKTAAAFRCSPLVAGLAMALAPQMAAAATIAVTTNSNSGAGSLRQAILDANANCASDPAPTITFPAGPFVISPSSALPGFICTTNTYAPTIDGYFQPDSSRNTLADGFNAIIQVIIDGSSMSFGDCGLTYSEFLYGGRLTVQGLEIRNFNYGGSGTGLCGNIRALGNRIRGNGTGISLDNNSEIGDGTAGGRNVIGGNTNEGIEMFFSSATSISGNFIGTLDGVTAAPNSTGIYMNEADPSSIVGNVISGNTFAGIEMYDDGGTVISGNKIGVDASGTSPLPNQYGIVLNYSYGDAFNPGTSITSNTISGNSSKGVWLSYSDKVTLTANKIGTNSAGTSAIANGLGVYANCGTGHTLSGNVISGNWDGVVFGGVNASSLTGNKIGVAADGATALANGGSGVVIGSWDCVESGSGNSLFQNVIAKNGGDGIALQSGVGNTLSQNSVYDNGGKNININSSASPLPNDPPDPLAPGAPPYDADTGPNNQQNYPVISSVVQAGGNTTISFAMASTSATTFHVEVFDNPAGGAPAGRTYLGFVSPPVTTNASGVFSGSYTLSGILANHVSLTARSPTGDTSEFSPIRSAPPTPAVTLSATSLNFGAVAVGSTSPSQSVTVSSVGNVPYQINTFDSSSMCYGGPVCSGGGFTCSSTCATMSPYAPGTSCSVSASFSPSSAGSQSTTIYLCDNATGSPRSITLTGDGVVPTTVTITPAEFDFGNVLVGSKSATQAFRISNSSTSEAPIGPVQTIGAFVLESTNCGAAVPAIGGCDAVVSFAPTVPGFASGYLVAPPPDSTPASLAKVAKFTLPAAFLSGTGVQNAQLASPAVIAVGAYTLGSPALARTVTLANSGNAVLTFSSITASTPFTVVNNCPLNLLPGQSCTVTVGFSSTTAGEFNGTLTVVSNAPGGSRAIPLTATAQPQPVPVVRIAPTFIGFGSRMIGTQSAAQRITVVNEGGAQATLGGMDAGVDYLIASNTCGPTLASQASCFADVVFRPLGFGPRRGQFTFTSNSATSPHAVDLLGTGCRPFSMSNRSGAASACAP